MTNAPYLPDRGDIIWINFDPQAGHEQAKHRPAIVLSPRSYNRLTSLCILCPLTSKKKGYPFEVQIKDGKELSFILADQVKSLDWKARGAKFKQKAAEDVVEEVIAKLSVLIIT